MPLPVRGQRTRLAAIWISPRQTSLAHAEEGLGRPGLGQRSWDNATRGPGRPAPPWDGSRPGLVRPEGLTHSLGAAHLPELTCSLTPVRTRLRVASGLMSPGVPILRVNALGQGELHVGSLGVMPPRGAQPAPACPARAPLATHPTKETGMRVHTCAEESQNQDASLNTAFHLAPLFPR